MSDTFAITVTEETVNITVTGGVGPSGAASASGSAILSGGSVTVSTTKVKTASLIILTALVVSGVQGVLSVGTIVNGTSFVINSSSSGDNSTIAWAIL